MSDTISGILWQLFRQVLHRLYLGRWLAARAGGLRSSRIQTAEVKESARDAALVYHQLNQLHLTGETAAAFYFPPSLSLSLSLTHTQIKCSYRFTDCMLTHAHGFKKKNGNNIWHMHRNCSVQVLNSHDWLCFAPRPPQGALPFDPTRGPM